MRIYDLSGRLSLGVTGDDARAHTAVARQMEPFRAAPGEASGTTDVLLQFDGSPPGRVLEIHNPARDGLTTTFDGHALRLVVGGSACAMVRSADGPGLVLRCDPAFPVGPLFRRIVRPALQTVGVGRGVVAIHSAAVEIDGAAVLVAGWSESGKTETALALMEDGARWLSDKWTFVGADGQTSAFPITVGVRRWVLQYLPRLAAGLPRAARAQVAVAGAAAGVTRPLRTRGRRGGLVGAAAVAAERAVVLAYRAALPPDEIRAAYGQSDDATRRIPLGTVALLCTVPGPEISVEAADVQWAATRLALTGSYERHDWYMLQDRLRYADPSVPWEEREAAVAAESRVLERVLAGVRLLHVRAPFPVDPRAVADAIRQAM